MSGQELGPSNTGLRATGLTRSQSCLGLAAINMFGLRQAASILILASATAIAFNVEISEGFVDQDASAVVIEGWNLKHYLNA